eukprot:CAMPEP_0176271842 /NCGR_PEP_ID=MMETSP0121_2-20121125/45409_1 /TAXON_ID=160619 /ORGANISM="Kryptoperidinium foliaceum, Strain CCMP 1326" /LENGTH=37 /DNA_ID= /DNA_START= /DNA_END= /DNA_ORIENTATION=
MKRGGLYHTHRRELARAAQRQRAAMGTARSDGAGLPR